MKARIATAAVAVAAVAVAVVAVAVAVAAAAGRRRRAVARMPVRVAVRVVVRVVVRVAAAIRSGALVYQDGLLLVVTEVGTGRKERRGSFVVRSFAFLMLSPIFGLFGSVCVVYFRLVPHCPVADLARLSGKFDTF